MQPHVGLLGGREHPNFQLPTGFESAGYFQLASRSLERASSRLSYDQRRKTRAERGGEMAGLHVSGTPTEMPNKGGRRSAISHLNLTQLP